MENEQVFQAETEIAELNKHRSRDSRHSHDGYDAVQAAVGGFDTRPPVISERTRLLGQRQSDSPSDIHEGGNPPPDGNDGLAWDGEHEFDGLPWYKKPSIYWLLLPFLLFTTAYGGTFVPKVNLILSLICREYCAELGMTGPTSQLGSKPLKMGSDVDPACQIPPVQSAVTKFLLYMSLISGLLAAITSPKLGALSDRYGRLRIICASSAGMVVSEVLTIVIAKNPDMISVKWLLAGAIFDGLGGSFIAAMAVANAYATDCTHPSKRSVSFGYFYSCLYFGIALGPLFGGYIIKATGDILIIFYIALAGHGLFLLWLLFIVPESLSKRRQMMARKKLQDDYDGLSFSTNFASMEPGIGLAYHSIKSAVTRTNPFAPLAVLWPTGEGTTPALRRNLAFLAAVDTTMFGVTMGAVTCALLYSEYMFGWGNFETSIYVFVVNTCRVTVLIIVLPLITRILRGPAAKAVQRSSGCDGVDLGILRVAIIFDTLGYVGYAAVGTGPLFILSGAIAAIGNMGSPTLSASLTKHVPSDQTGRILGAMGLLHAIARIVAPLIFNLIYARTVGTVPQTVFVCLAATFALSFIFSLFIRPHISWDQTYQTSGTAVDNDSAGDSEPLIHAAPEPVDPEENGR